MDVLIVAVILTCAYGVLFDRMLARQDQERRELYQRIQAPQMAVMQHQADKAMEATVISPMTDEQVAERDALLTEMDEFERRLL